jgi:hypothetical protein
MTLRALVFVAALASGGLAYAQGPGGQSPSPQMQAAREAARKACAADAQTLCPGKEGREMMQCIRANSDKLSDGCKDALSKMPQRQH